MNYLHEVELGGRSTAEFEALVEPHRFAAARPIFDDVRSRLAGRGVWNINSTAVGGGVAEMIRPLVSYCRGEGLDARWLVVRGSAEFFHITKRLHHALHGSSGDGTPLDRAARDVYEQTLRESGLELCALVRPDDLVVLHDPQTAGLAPHVLRSGARVIWRCHIGDDHPSAEAERGWEFLAPYLRDVHAVVVSREAHRPAIVEASRCVVIQPSIDAFSPKNVELDEPTVHSILVHTGLVEGPPPKTGHRSFQSSDGTPRRVDRHADVIRLGRAPLWDTPLVVQVSRWDPLKDPEGVLRGFAVLADGRVPADAELVLAGPNVHGVADDPEAASAFARVLAAWRGLPHTVRDRVHLACLPTADVEENAVIVNALQRHAAIVVQKSLREGFGLTVTEGMWKFRPVVASAVGGIQDQIEDGVSGLLLKDPRNLDAFAASLRRLLGDPQLAKQLGEAAHERVRERFLGIRHLLDYARLLQRIEADLEPG